MPRSSPGIGIDLLGAATAAAPCHYTPLTHKAPAGREEGLRSFFGTPLQDEQAPQERYPELRLLQQWG